ncbi:hypothetical protein BC826DRAFT_995186 [Russula brevipes]|nr:hypothetical protein BC826DRAFT_995186 [Russula brevipes]
MEPNSEVSLHDTNFASLPLILISPIFGRISDDMCTPQEDLRSGDFAPARNLANMLSLLEDEPTRKVYFRKWLLETLEVKLSDNRHELSEPGLPRPAAMITKGILKDVQIDGHVEWKDYRTTCKSGAHIALASPACQRFSLRPYIDISGAIVCPNGSVQVEALMPGLRVDCDVRDNRQRNLLAGLVRALTNAFDGLMKFYKSPSGPVSGYPSASGYASGEDGESIDCWFPYRNSYTDQYDTEHTFEYDSRLTQGPLIFVAKHTDPKVIPNLIVVKFTRAYSKAVHNLLAAKGFAPNLFAVEDLAGGWKMVVMEFLLEPDWTMLEMKTHEERLRYKEKLWEALCVIHDKKLVHGDVRGPNILVSKDGDVKLIDFDYCGTHEQVRYQREWDHTNRSVDAKEGDLIRKEHDVFEFNKIFDNSQS